MDYSFDAWKVINFKTVFGIIKENEGSGHQARLRFRLCLV